MPRHTLPHQLGGATWGWGLHIGDETTLLAVTVGQDNQALQGISVEKVGLWLTWGRHKKKWTSEKQLQTLAFQLFSIV